MLILCYAILTTYLLLYLYLSPMFWSKCISSVTSRTRTASRNVLFSSARISKALNVDRVPPLNDDSQDVTQFGSSGDDLQAFIDEFDLMS